MSTIRVAIAGATGYAGEELIRILQYHPAVQLTSLAASAKWDRPVPVSDVFPRLANTSKLLVESLDPERLAQHCDVALLALPHTVSMDVAPVLLSAGRKVIDLAGDFRLKDPNAFTRWYGTTHRHPELLPDAVYGLSELAREAIQQARLVANPGCYATSVILAVAPLLHAKLIDPAEIVVDAKSGVTGAGRKPEPQLMFAELAENLWPYKVNGHQHVPEIAQALAPFGGPSNLCFVPHVVPLTRGILSTIYLRLAKNTSREAVGAAFQTFYREAPFVRLKAEGQWPSVRAVTGTNFCDLGFAVDADARRLIVVAAIDNLVKGAAGQAVQNLNLMCGLPETTGLL